MLLSTERLSNTKAALGLWAPGANRSPRSLLGVVLAIPGSGQPCLQRLSPSQSRKPAMPCRQSPCVSGRLCWPVKQTESCVVGEAAWLGPFQRRHTFLADKLGHTLATKHCGWEMGADRVEFSSLLSHPQHLRMKGFTLSSQNLNEGKEEVGWGLAREETRRLPKFQSLDCCFSFSCKKIPRKS